VLPLNNPEEGQLNLANISEDKELRRNAREVAAGKFGFYIHLAAYAVVNLLIFLSWWFSGALYVWIFPWFVFPLLGWGGGILAHYVCVFPTSYVESKAEQEYWKLKERAEAERREKAAINA
jgi:hypothetical protein